MQAPSASLDHDDVQLLQSNDFLIHSKPNLQNIFLNFQRLAAFLLCKDKCTLLYIGLLTEENFDKLKKR